MNYLSGVITGVVGTVLTVFGAGAIWWIFIKSPEVKKSPPPPIPANVEANFNTVTISEKAEENLALRLGTVEELTMRRSRFYGGEVMVTPGQSITVSAPFSGTLQTASKGPLIPGTKVEKGTVLFKLSPILTPEGRATLTAAKVDARAQVENAKTQEVAAEKNLLRARMLLMDSVGSKQRVEDAEVAYSLAVKNREAADERAKLLAKITGDAEEGTAEPIPIESPSKGLIRNVLAAHGQNVPSGAVLFEVFDPDQVWIRVPVSVGDRPEIDTKKAAKVGDLSLRSTEPARDAEWIDAPFTANPATGTIDLYYSFDNSKSKYSPGQRVAVTLSLKSDAKNLTIPAAALIADIHGGTWVYEKTGERAYTRKRVIVKDIRDGTAVLAEGPPKGTKIVTDGAMELFGTETGYSK